MFRQGELGTPLRSAGARPWQDVYLQRIADCVRSRAQSDGDCSAECEKSWANVFQKKIIALAPRSIDGSSYGHFKGASPQISAVSPEDGPVH